jgi:hypothetical protein
VATDGQRLPHLLFHAELQSLVVSGPMDARQHTYAAYADRVPSSPTIDEDEALARLARRYFTTRGPAVVGDFAWWSGLDMPTARRALDLVAPELVRAEADGRTWWFVDLGPVAGRGRADLVQCYDEVIIGYRTTRDVLRTGPASFDVPFGGDGFPHVVLHDGRLLGRWRARSGSREVEVELAVAPTSSQEKAVGAAVARYCRFAAS